MAYGFDHSITIFTPSGEKTPGYIDFYNSMFKFSLTNLAGFVASPPANQLRVGQKRSDQFAGGLIFGIILEILGFTLQIQKT
jgi:hypothetical protein